MKLTITAEEWRGLRCVRAVAIMPKSKKLGVPHKLQKTWTVETVAPKFTLEEMRPAFEAEAKRWEAKKMAKIAKAKELSEAVEKMKERLSEPVQ